MIIIILFTMQTIRHVLNFIILFYFILFIYLLLWIPLRPSRPKKILGKNYAI